LKKNGFTVHLIDAIAEELSYKNFFARVVGLHPQLLIAEKSTVSLRHDLNVLAGFRGKFPLALCGPEIHLSDPEFLRQTPLIDYLFFGEYEASVLELAQKLAEHKGLRGVNGLIYREDAAIIKNPPRPLIADLDWLPWPLRERIPLKRYNDSPGDIPIPCASMWASRGCAFRCSFCLWPQVMYGGNTYRTRSVVNVVDEMEYLVKHLGFKSIYFDDDTWNIGRERMFEFCDELQRRNFRIPWAIMARAELMDTELLERMRKTGLFAVKYGVESSSQTLLNNIQKGTNLKRVEEIVNYTKYLGIRTHLTFTFGLPGEDSRTLRQTIDYAIALNPTSVQFSLATPFPGTRFYDEMDAQGHILTKDWERFDGNHSSVIRTAALTGRQLQDAKKTAYAQWEKHCRLKVKKTLRAVLPLRSRFQAVLAERGLTAALLKSLRYLLRRVWFFPLRLKQFFGKKMWIIEEKIERGGLKLKFGEGRVHLYWNDTQVSKDVGMNTSLHCGQRWIDSSMANWKLEKQSEHSIIVKLKWDEEPVRQQWDISLSDDAVISWSITMQIDEDLEIL
jgi:radical SAM superfamily enzyme YgiQ (UPF0313 family)